MAFKVLHSLTLSLTSPPLLLHCSHSGLLPLAGHPHHGSSQMFPLSTITLLKIPAWLMPSHYAGFPSMPHSQGGLSCHPIQILTLPPNILSNISGLFFSTALITNNILHISFILFMVFFPLPHQNVNSSRRGKFACFFTVVINTYLEQYLSHRCLIFV